MLLLPMRKGALSVHMWTVCMHKPPFQRKSNIHSRRAKVVDASQLYPYNSKNQNPNNFRAVSVNKQTVNTCHTQCAILSVPYSVCHTQCAILSVPYSVYHTQCTILSVPYSVCHTQCTILSVPYSVYHTQCTILSVPYSVCQLLVISVLISEFIKGGIWVVYESIILLAYYEKFPHFQMTV